MIMFFAGFATATALLLARGRHAAKRSAPRGPELRDAALLYNRAAYAVLDTVQDAMLDNAGVQGDVRNKIKVQRDSRLLTLIAYLDSMAR